MTIGIVASLSRSVIAQDAQDIKPAQTTGSESVDPNVAGVATAPPADTSKEANPVATPATSTETTDSVEGSTPAAAVYTPKDPRTLYGLWAMLPAVVAIILAILTRQVVPALVMGLLVGAYMMVPCVASGSNFAAHGTAVRGFRLAAETYLFGTLTDTTNGSGHLKIIFFTLIIGFMVGVIGRNGGTTGMVKLVAGESQSPRRGALTAWFAGIVVFFDDYANTMIVGPTMRPVFDRLKISRAKLAYIVDSTAAPVASIALVGTWVGTEVSYINGGLAKFDADTAPAFLLNASGDVLSGMGTFISSIPYRFYPLLALFLVFLVALTGRDFGPMKRAERAARSLGESKGDTEPDAAPAIEQATPCWWLGLIPVVTLVVATMAVLALTGYANIDTATAFNESTPWWEKASTIIGNADSYISIFYGAIASALVAVVLTMVSRTCPTRDAVEAGLDGTSRIMPAIVILVLAWAISAVLSDLQVGEIMAAKLQAAQFPARWLPLAVFTCAALISFATGTSWGTMAILCPMTVEIAARLMADTPTAEALPIFYGAVGSVLAGAVFGDHCSPISDTTVLSSIASGCRHEEHVWTQLPYALVAAVAAMGLGDVLCSVYKQPWYLGLAAGGAFLVVWIFVVGRKSQAPAELAPA